jgi:putative membrane-bound dehydrogenase-like protein
VDLGPHQGKEVFVRLVDDGTGGWGHLNFDAFQLHATQPGPVSPSDVPLVADEYPFEGLKAPEAVQAMKVPDGFRVIAAAAEPDIKQPIAMALDERGRVWVAEAYEYPVRAPEGQGRDRILIFEDTNGDGTLDSRKVFAEGLNLISGMEVGFGGVWVGAAPYFMFIADANKDDKADGAPTILLDGWGLQDTHETLNTFNWGPDGWLYGCHGVFTHSKVGKPGTPDQDRQPINAGVWRYHPTRHVFEVFSHGTSNPWGVDFNDRGQAFITSCVIPHLYHMIQGGRYERQAGQHFNPYTYDDIKTIADHAHYAGGRIHKPDPLKIPETTDVVGGGHAHSGLAIYNGDNFPAAYRGLLIFGNLHGHRLVSDQVVPAGSGFAGHHGNDFLRSNDATFIPVSQRVGPDGALYVSDWSDVQVCHNNTQEIWDRTNGRLYRVSYGNPVSRARDLGKLADAELVEIALADGLEHPQIAAKHHLPTLGAGAHQPQATGVEPGAGAELHHQAGAAVVGAAHPHLANQAIAPQDAAALGSPG